MSLDPALVGAIDDIRASGPSSPRAVERELARQGVKDPRRAVGAYMALPTPDGRTKAQVNPGDPAEWGVE